MHIRFAVATADFSEDAVMVMRADVDGDPTILVISRAGMNARVASDMARAQLTVAERDEFRRQCGLPSTAERPGSDVWEDVPVEKSAVRPEHWINGVDHRLMILSD